MAFMLLLQEIPDESTHNQGNQGSGPGPVLWDPPLLKPTHLLGS